MGVRTPWIYWLLTIDEHANLTPCFAGAASSNPLFSVLWRLIRIIETGLTDCVVQAVMASELYDALAVNSKNGGNLTLPGYLSRLDRTPHAVLCYDDCAATCEDTQRFQA